MHILFSDRVHASPTFFSQAKNWLQFNVLPALCLIIITFCRQMFFIKHDVCPFSDFLLTANNHKMLSEFGIRNGTRLQADDFLQDYTLLINVLHRWGRSYPTLWDMAEIRISAERMTERLLAKRSNLAFLGQMQKHFSLTRQPCP